MKKRVLLFIFLFTFFITGVSFAYNLNYDGIYKDIGNIYNLNIYVQTYDNGGTLLLYTFDTANMYAFWDDTVIGDFFDGSPINPADFGQLGAQFDFLTNVLYIIDYVGGTTVAYGCYKFAGIGSTGPTTTIPVTTTSPFTTTVPAGFCYTADDCYYAGYIYWVDCCDAWGNCYYGWYWGCDTWTNTCMDQWDLYYYLCGVILKQGKEFDVLPEDITREFEYGADGKTVEKVKIFVNGELRAIINKKK
ncbi:MAG TPA: hypothetical protein ENI51_08395 [Candidatus Atribacteria bacterium]|nr:hypothetical protein [Candidatus Atribacteria bacterium]